MTRKIIITLLAVILINTVSITSTAYEKQTPKPIKNPPVPKHLVQQQQKVNEVRKTKEGQEIFRLVDIYSKKYDVDKRLVHAVILAESGYNPKATSSANARGLMQLKDVHAGKVNGCYDLYNKKCNIETGVKHLSGLLARHDGDVQLALASYNAGGGAVDRSLRRTGHIPTYTKPYVNKVLEYKTIF